MLTDIIWSAFEDYVDLIVVFALQSDKPEIKPVANFFIPIRMQLTFNALDIR
jgi:hypothetical protein